MIQSSFVTSKDGTAIHCRRIGSGPGLVLVHGGMQTAGSLSRLAERLSDRFTVHSMDRRGRRPSGPAGDDYSLQKEIDDLGAVVSQTGSHHVFGLSSGALITLRAALEQGAITKIALYEPPMEIAGAPESPLACKPRFEKAMAEGNLPGALVAALKGIDDPSLMTRMPGFILEPLFRHFMRSDKPANGPPVAELIPTMQHDMIVAGEMAGTVERYRALDTDVLLLGGDKSQPFLAVALDALAATLPRVSRVCLKGTGHLAAANDGVPDRVAAELRRFFAEGV